jgi:hypothetical protein
VITAPFTALVLQPARSQSARRCASSGTV